MRRSLAFALLASACVDYDLGRQEEQPTRPRDRDPRPEDTAPVEDTERPPPDTEAPEDTDRPVDESEPVADAGPDQVVDLYSTVWLDGTGSYDPGGHEPLTYAWTIVRKPSGSTVDLTWMSWWSNPVLSPDKAGEYVFELGVTNTLGVSDSTPDRVTLTANQPRLEIELEWDTSPTDIDLHVLRSNAGIFDEPDDCCFCNMAPGWGAAGTADDPGLYWDDVDGLGPEYVTIDEPASGDYRILLHFYGENGKTSCDGACQRTRSTVTVTADGARIGRWQGTLSDVGDVWEVATVTWPAATATTVDTTTTTTRSACW